MSRTGARQAALTSDNKSRMILRPRDRQAEDRRAGEGFWGSIAARFSKRDLLEGALVGVAFLLYFAVRGAVIERPEQAYRHALDIVNLQRALGFFWEDDLNRWTEHHRFVAQAMNVIYFYLHFPLIIAFGIWLYYFRRHCYTLSRDSFLASGAIALIIYWAYPVAPPRQLPELAARFDPGAPSYIQGFLDTMHQYLGYAYDTQSTRAFVNPYAAMPSLHFGWDLLLGVAIIRAFWKERWLWIMAPIGVALPALQVFSITMTANHFLLDAVAGGIVALAGIALALAVERWVYPWVGGQLRRSPVPALRQLAEEPAPKRERAGATSQ